MKLDISKAMLHHEQVFPFSAQVSLDPFEINGDQITVDSVSLEGTFENVEDTIHLRGTLHTVAHGVCALCMEPAHLPIDISFDELFKRDANEIDEEQFSYSGKDLPLDHMTLTLVMTNFPMRVICKDDCAGSQEYQAYKTFNAKIVKEVQEEVATQRPFANLQSLLNTDEEV